MYKIVELKLPNELITGIKTIDQQHKELLRLTEMLVNSVGERLSNEIVKENLDFLDRYVIEHFKDEEAFQIGIGFPGYEAHKRQHDKFLESFVKMKEYFILKGNTDLLQQQINDSIITWVFNHILKEDLTIAQYYRKIKT